MKLFLISLAFFVPGFVLGFVWAPKNSKPVVVMAPVKCPMPEVQVQEKLSCPEPQAPVVVEAPPPPAKRAKKRTIAHEVPPAFQPLLNLEPLRKSEPGHDLEPPSIRSISTKE